MKKERKKVKYSVDPLIRAQQIKERRKPIIMWTILIMSIVVVIVGFILLIFVNLILGIVIIALGFIPGIIVGLFYFNGGL